jgi:RNA polymerase sigma-70 factor (ECF subfamily)
MRPDDAASQSEILAYLGNAIARLPHDLRVAFVLCDVEGTSGTEAARALSIPEGTLYRRVHEARKRLKADMEGLLR